MIAAGIALLLLCILLIVGLPMVAALMVAVVVDFMLTDAWPTTLPQLMLSGLGRFVLIALPMFVLAGGIMNAGGISGRLFDFARSLVGPLRGGLAHVNVLTSMFFGGMIGSSTADLAGTGSVVIPAMKKAGYPADVTAAISASSSGVGPMIPPSSPMILYSAVTGTSLGALFLAGVIPGILLGLSQMLIVAWLSKRHGWKPYAAFSLVEIWATGKRAVLSFGLPIIIVSGLVLGVFTPTEASAFAVVYALVLACTVYRALPLRSLYRVFANAVQMTGELLLIVALSFALGWGMANAHVPEILAKTIDLIVIYDLEFLRLLSMMILAILAGMILDPLIPVLLPIILPTLLIYQIDLVHFGILMVMAVVIGQVTPPMAIALVISGKLADVDQMEVFRANMPFLWGMLIFTLLLMLVPEIATWLPSIARD